MYLSGKIHFDIPLLFDNHHHQCVCVCVWGVPERSNVPLPQNSYPISKKKSNVKKEPMED